MAIKRMCQARELKSGLQNTVMARSKLDSLTTREEEKMAALTSKDITLLNDRRGQMTVRGKGKVR